MREVISAKISTLLNTTMLNNHIKFRAKIFKPYRVITFLVLGHFFSRTL